MIKARYMVVSHPAEDIDKNPVPIHGMLANYHWSRLDDQHVFLMGNYSVGHHVALHAHDKVSILPSVSSSKKVVHHCKHDHHRNALQHALTLDDTHVMEDVIDKAEAKFGPVFSHAK